MTQKRWPGWWTRVTVFLAVGVMGPSAAEEVQGVIGIESALDIEGQMEIQQRHGGHGTQLRTLFLESQVPSRVGGQAGGATDLMLVVPADLGLEQRVGVFVIGDFFVGQQGDEAFLEGIKAAFDFALGLGVGGDAVSGAQRGESALELGMGVEPVGGRTMAKEGEAVGVEAGGRAVAFQGRAQVGEVIPGGVAADEGAGHNFTRVVVEGENEHGIMIVGPPGMGRRVVLPEFADGARLPAAAGFGAAFGRGHMLGEVLADVGGHCGTGAVKVMATGQFVSQEGEVQRLAMGQEPFEEIVDGRWPGVAVIAAGGGGLKTVAILQPLMAQLIEPGGADQEALGSGGGVEGAVVEGGQDFPDEE
jgi:hypothetical protein